MLLEKPRGPASWMLELRTRGWGAVRAKLPGARLPVREPPWATLLPGRELPRTEERFQGISVENSSATGEWPRRSSIAYDRFSRRITGKRQTELRLLPGQAPHRLYHAPDSLRRFWVLCGGLLRTLRARLHLQLLPQVVDASDLLQ